MRRLLERDSTCRPSSTPTRSTSSSRSSAAAPTVLTPHAGELARLLGVESELGRRAPARGRAAGGRALRLRLPAQGRRHARRRAGRGRARRRARHRRRSRRPARATCSPGIVAAFLAKGWTRGIAAAAAAAAQQLASRGSVPQRGLVACDVVSRAAAACSMHRSELTIDLGAVRRNARTLLRRARRRAALGGREGRRLRPRRGRRRRRRARRGRAAPLRRDGRRRRSRCERSSRSRGSSSWARRSRAARSREAREAALELAVSERDDSRRASRVHLKLDTGMGRCGLAELPSRRPEVVGLMTPPRDRRLRPGLRRASSSSASATATAPYADLDAPRREQRRGAAAPRVALRRGALRDRALRPLAVRRATRPTDGLEPVLSWRSELAQVKRLRARREHRLRAPLRRRAADLDRDRAGRLRGRLPPRPDRHRGARRRRAAARRRHGLDGLLRGRARRRAAGGNAGDAPRPRRARRGARARRRARSTTSSSARISHSDPRARAADGRRWLELVEEALRRRGGLDRRRRRSRRAARPASWSTSTSPAAIPSAPPARCAKRVGGAPFPLSERHGAWRVALDGRPDGRLHAAARVDRGRPCDAATSRINAIAEPRRQRRGWSTPSAGYGDLAAHRLRAVSESVFEDDPLRLLRAVRLEDELPRLPPGSRDRGARPAGTRALVTRPAGERILAELRRLSPSGYRRLDELGLLEPLGGADRRPARPLGLARLPAGGGLRRGPPAAFPSRNEQRRYARTLLAGGAARGRSAFHPPLPPRDRALGARGARVRGRVRACRRRRGCARGPSPPEPLLRGDELGLPPGPEIGRLLGAIEEERAAGTIATREEALEYARRNAGTVREDR